MFDIAELILRRTIEELYRVLKNRTSYTDIVPEVLDPVVDKSVFSTILEEYPLRRLLGGQRDRNAKMNFWLRLSRKERSVKIPIDL